MLKIIPQSASWQRGATLSTICSASAEPQSMAGQSWTSALLATLERWFAAYLTWCMKRVVIAQLWSMSDHELKAIGLARSDIAEAVKGDTVRDRANNRCY
jgi:uncharacterized protein YjiS (DUF1127 family)